MQLFAIPPTKAMFHCSFLAFIYSSPFLCSIQLLINLQNLKLSPLSIQTEPRQSSQATKSKVDRTKQQGCAPLLSSLVLALPWQRTLAQLHCLSWPQAPVHSSHQFVAILMPAMLRELPMSLQVSPPITRIPQTACMESMGHTIAPKHRVMLQREKKIIRLKRRAIRRHIRRLVPLITPTLTLLRYITTQARTAATLPTTTAQRRHIRRLVPLITPTLTLLRYITTQARTAATLPTTTAQRPLALHMTRQSILRC